ncbi:MAG: hypothetical protein E6J99_01000 [Methanobacteriota archaeon]|nr:MAG: hypothetical protein E6J99_01000 [Euryarchaeota archaeon]
MWSPPPTVPSSTGLGPFPARARRLGFFERLRIGWQLTKVSLSILRREKGLILLPFLSLLTTGVAWILFFLGIFFFVPNPTNPFGSVFFYAGLAVVYFITFFVSIYFNAAVMGAAMIRLNGGDPTISDGLKVANENLRRIAGWALLSATVGLILRAIAERAGIIGRIIAGFAGAAWGVITYLVVPVLIFEKVGPWAAVKRSGSLLRKTWGEAMGGYFSLGAIFLLLALPGLLLLLGGVAIGGIVGLLIGGAVAVVYWLILGLLGAAAQSILVTALYRYATTGKLGFGFPEGLLATGTAASR